MVEAYFRQGQWVEVTSDEEGFRGAWFVAKIIKLPLGWNDYTSSTSSSLSSSANKRKLLKRKDEFLIEYKSIMEDAKGTKRLREYVHTSFTRPSPPKEPGRVFELNELVDAFDRDGWWKGEVIHVYENQFKYVVYFKSTDEKMVFVQSDVRVHLEWIDGIWTKPRNPHPYNPQQDSKQHDAEGSQKIIKKRGRPPKEKSPTEQGKVVCKSKETNKQIINSSKRRRGNGTKCKVNDKGSGLKAFGSQASHDTDLSNTLVLRVIEDEFQSPPGTDNEEIVTRKNPSVVSTKVLGNIADEYQSPPIVDNMATEDDPLGITEKLSDISDEQQSSPVMDNKDGILVSKSNNAATEEDPSSSRTEILRDTEDEHQSSPMIDKKGSSPDGRHVSESNNTTTEVDPSVRTEILRDIAHKHQSSPGTDTAEEHHSSPMIDKKGSSPDGRHVSESNNTTTEVDPLVSLSEILRDIAHKHQSSPGKDTAEEHHSSPMIDKKEISPGRVSQSNDPLGITEILSDISDEQQSSPVMDNKGILPDGILVSKSNNAATKEDPPSRTEILRDTADEHQSSPMIDKKGSSPDGRHASESNNTTTEVDPSVRTEILRDIADKHQSSPGTDTAEEHHSSPVIDKKEISPGRVSQSNEVATQEDTLLKDLEIPESFSLTKSSEEDTCMGNQCTDAVKEQNEMAPVSVDNQCTDSRKVEKEVTLASVYNRCDEASAKQNSMEESRTNHETRKECDEVHLETPVIGSTNDKVSVENESWPFAKTSSMWKTILSEEIFQKMPQRPHFRPLKQYNMSKREGMAFGHMVTFTNVVAKTRASHIDDPRSSLEEISTTLVDLEAHGFDVQEIQSRVQRLLEMKDKQLMLNEKSKRAEMKFIELKNEEAEAKAQLDEVKKNLKFHEEATIKYKNDHDFLMEKIEKIGSDNSVYQMELDATANDSVKLEYSNVAAGW